MDNSNFPPQNNQIPTANPQQGFNTPIPQRPNNFISKKIVIALIFIFIIIITSTAIFFITEKSRKNTTQRIPDTLLAKVGEEPIYKSMVERAAREQYAPSAINKKVMQQFLNTLIEQKILSMEAKKNGITMSPAESSQINNAPSSYKNRVRYEIIKRKITEKLVTYRTGYTIGYWIPSKAENKDPSVETLRLQGPKMLEEAAALLRKNIIVKDVAQYIYSKYPLVQPRLAVNGYIYSANTNGNSSLFSKPQIFYDGDKKYYGKYFYDALYSMKQGEVKVAASSETDANVILLISINNAKYSNYKDFISQKTKEYVKYINAL